MAHSDDPQASSAGPLSAEQRKLASLMARRLRFSRMVKAPSARFSEMASTPAPVVKAPTTTEQGE
jgi:hypothetical protein